MNCDVAKFFYFSLEYLKIFIEKENSLLIKKNIFKAFMVYGQGNKLGDFRCKSRKPTKNNFSSKYINPRGHDHNRLILLMWMIAIEK